MKQLIVWTDSSIQLHSYKNTSRVRIKGEGLGLRFEIKGMHFNHFVEYS